MGTLDWQRNKHPDYRSADYIIDLPNPYNVPSSFLEMGIATLIHKWYNRNERSWVVSYGTWMDINGTKYVTQIGSSEYVYSNDDADIVATALLRQATKG